MVDIAIVALITGSLSSCQIYDRYAEYSRLNQVFDSKKSDIAQLKYELFVTPDKNVEEMILHTIYFSNESILLSIYLLTSEKIIDGLIDAKNRGLEVKVLLEKSVYQLPKINHPTFERLQRAGVQVRWSSETDINFNHSKYMIVDGKTAIIGTGNFTKSTFEANRDYFILLHDSGIIWDLKNIFERDFNEIITGYLGNSLVVSPDNSLKQVTSHILKAKKSIQIFAPSLEDDGLLQLLEIQAKKGVTVRICTPMEEKNHAEILFQGLLHSGAQFYWSKKPFTHGKTILVDEGSLFVGSMNFTSNSLKNNREIGLILPLLENKELYQNTFQSDCKR